ncbi:ejaculatory bulb-specific protein 3-like [Frankliniella occidentalis]|uniref:Ejaculatory bulb-specific protein 3-like n=1 Tax=Frankliniella occidentalis TaxID=133901 RepID=A0A6J1SF07_FRAOC|nr:ejaculatory bulb-specific protein 3-like [Frankliniella occidentalis]WBW64318.1 CSP7 [Frankliniella occidentalis]
MVPLRTAVAVLVLAAVARAALVQRVRRDDDDDEKYTSRFDNVDLDTVLNSDRLLTNYFRCIMDEGPCTPDAKELKRVIPEALSNKCAKCSERHRAGAEKVLTFLIKNREAEWTRLEKKYDPSGQYRKLYEAEAAQRGLKI